MKNNVVTLSDQDVSYQIHLPDQDTDYIQGKISKERVPYELDMLRDMQARLSTDDLLLDIGANIGNHSLFMAALSGCTVEAFEPNVHLARALEKSVALNAFGDRLKVHATAIGAHAGHAAYQSQIPENLGAMTLDVGQGDIPVVRLDDHGFQKPVRMMKIDVEGMELAVLQGADQLISKDRPLIYVECITETGFDAIFHFLDQHDYYLWGTFNVTPTHLFIPREKISIDADLCQKRKDEAISAYRTSELQKSTRANLDTANMKYRGLSEQMKDTQSDVDRLKETLLQRDRKIAEMEAKKALNARGIPDVPADIVAAWARALPIAPSEIAVPWMDLAKSLTDKFPAQALALMHISHVINPADDVCRTFGFHLIEMGLTKDALRILEPLAKKLNLSSREQRLLALARTELSAAQVKKQAKTIVRNPTRIATIMDEFTYHGYAPECDLQQLSVTGWKEELERFQPELLVIESAWRGLHDEWAGKIAHLSAEFQGILSWCQDKGIQTAFWNKEDPVHFKTFLTIAQKFDMVFTTDIDCISQYKAELEHDRVHLLPFACQPEVHNPIEIAPRQDAFCFAGAYYTRYPDRTRVMDDFMAELSTSRPFVIYDRNFGKDLPDYMFPEAYQKYILGTLAPAEIDKAYKGYTFGINLNSVQFSQTMYARRVFELLASNTRVVSNYALGLRLMFGELVVCTDSGAEAMRRINRQDESGRADRLKLAGLRKVMSEHTYSHRIAYILDKAGLSGNAPLASALPPVTIFAKAETQAEHDRLVEQFRNQSLDTANLVMALNADVISAGSQQSDRIRYVPATEAADISITDLVQQDGWVAGFVPTDHYGSHYLTDLILATRYSQASAIGKDACHTIKDGTVLCGDGVIYGSVDQLALRRSILRHDSLPDDRLASWLERLPNAVFDAGVTKALAIDPYNYCADCGDDNPANVVDDLPDADVGVSQERLTDMADNMAATPKVDLDIPMISGADIADNMIPPASQDVTWQINGESCVVTSTLGAGVHTYIYEKQLRPLSDLQGPNGYRAHLLCGPGINVRFVVIYLDENNNKISNQIGAANTNTPLQPPEDAQFVRLGLRYLGPGTCEVHGLAMDNHYPAPRTLIAGSRVLLVTDNYPSYDDLYRNGFVHSRVRAYREMGAITPDIYRVRAGQDMTSHEFENVNCITGSTEQLDHLLDSDQYDHVLVHFLNPAMWAALSKHTSHISMTVWVHGSEVQPWWRRTFNYTTDTQLEKAKVESTERLSFWRRIFDDLPKNLRFVFVSRHFAEEVFEDLDVTCPHDQYEIIHNPIDDNLFSYQVKNIEQRAKILSIRPFASAKYANDLSVAAILSLKKYDFFKQLEFKIIGDGRLFDEITEPLKDLENVTCQKGYLSHGDIAKLHKEYGVFLNPTRMDAQGVSRDEAMSSGLVPVTSNVAAIPEFVDDNCGYLAAGEDAEGLAQAIIEMWRNPEIFAAKSRAAAARVRAQSGKDLVIAAELSLFEKSAHGESR